jgi:sugar lactone lactonase YvrE
MSDQVEVTIFSGEQLSLGEGPLTNHLRSSLVWCDINGSAVYERSYTGTTTRKFDLPVLPSAAGLIDEKHILVATETDFRVLDLDSGEMEIGIRFPEDPLMRSNDGRVHPCGAFWIGTMAKDGKGRPGAIFHLLDGQLTKMIDQVVTPNAICFAEDGTFAYYTDTPGQTIWKIPTDGAVLDGEGNLWNAHWGSSVMDVYNLGGERIHSYELPVRQPTCPAFIGDNLDQIVTTSATAGLKDATAAEGAVIQIHAPVVGRREPIVRP